jgi:DNA-binding transcriptional MerR regulator
LQCHTSVMSAERVYEAAARLHVSSRRLLVYLAAQAMPHRSASSALSPEAAQLLADVDLTDLLTKSVEHVQGERAKPRRIPLPFWDDDDWDPPYLWRNWIGPDELSTAEAAAAYAVAPATIRQWVRRGHLTPLRSQGRTLVFDAGDVHRAAQATGDRNRQPGGPLSRGRTRRSPAGRALSARLLGRLVTADVAARAVDVSPSTIRSWQKRGHLRAATHRGRTPLYLLADVVAAARRPAHRPRRKPKPLI